MADDANLADYDRDTLTAFLSGSSSGSDGYAPQSGQITGILKQMIDEMSANLSDMTTAETAAMAFPADLGKASSYTLPLPPFSASVTRNSASTISSEASTLTSTTTPALPTNLGSALAGAADSTSS